MKAKKWFYAKGQSAGAKKHNFQHAMIDAGIINAPLWVREVFRLGWHNAFNTHWERKLPITMLSLEK